MYGVPRRNNRRRPRRRYTSISNARRYVSRRVNPNARRRYIRRNIPARRNG